MLEKIDGQILCDTNSLKKNVDSNFSRISISFLDEAIHELFFATLITKKELNYKNKVYALKVNYTVDIVNAHYKGCEH